MKYLSPFSRVTIIDGVQGIDHLASQTVLPRANIIRNVRRCVSYGFWIRVSSLFIFFNFPQIRSVYPIGDGRIEPVSALADLSSVSILGNTI